MAKASGRSVAVLLALAVAASTNRASAQDAPAVPAAPAAPDPDAAAHADYDDAFAAMVAGDFARAAIGFDGVAARAQDRELAAAARELGRLAHELVGRKASFTAARPAPPGATEEADEGRTTFVVWTTMFSLYAGVVAVDDLDLSDFRSGIATVTGTTAIGLFGSLYGTRGRLMTGAMADSYSLGMVEGFANAGLLVTPLDLTRSSGEVQTTLLLSGAAGAGAGLAYGYAMKPTRGQVSFAGTVSLLGFATTGLGYGIVEPVNVDGNAALTAMAGGADLGLAAGLVFGRDLDWSVSRGRIVQLGSLLGGLAGLAAGALVTGTNVDNDRDTRILAGTTLAGVWAGFAIAVRATEDMQPDARFPTSAPGPSAQLAPMPVPGGAGVTLVGRF